MKAACCRQEIVIQTDPQNCEYVIISGAEKKTEDYDPEDAETLVLPSDAGRLTTPCVFSRSFVLQPCCH